MSSAKRRKTLKNNSVDYVNKLLNFIKWRYLYGRNACARNVDL